MLIPSGAADSSVAEPAEENNGSFPFALRYMQGPPINSLTSRGKTATSRQTIEDGEEEADTDWDET